MMHHILKGRQKLTTFSLNFDQSITSLEYFFLLKIVFLFQIHFSRKNSNSREIKAVGKIQTNLCAVLKPFLLKRLPFANSLFPAKISNFRLFPPNSSNSQMRSRQNPKKICGGKVDFRARNGLKTASEMPTKGNEARFEAARRCIEHGAMLLKSAPP